MGAEKIRVALAKRKARGLICGGARYGYRNVGGKLVPDEGEQRILALVRELRALGLSLRAIVGELEARGVLSRAGKPYSRHQVWLMLGGRES